MTANRTRSRSVKGLRAAVLFFAMLALVSVLFLAGCGRKEASPDLAPGFVLNERDIALEVGDTARLRLTRETDGKDVTDPKPRWESEKGSVARVSSDGKVTAVSGGETVIRAVIDVDGSEFDFPCVVTVKTPKSEYSGYKIRYYTQKRDRSGYDVEEESFEREVGSRVEISSAEARRRLPGNYTLNTKKSRLSGQVGEKAASCVIEIYYDVSQVTWYVDSYFESAAAAGRYASRETKAYKAYAFTPVAVPDEDREGFTKNTSVPGTVLSNDSVTEGLRLVVYFDRVKGDVTVRYAGGKPDATYRWVYGIGLLDAPDDVFRDSADPFDLVWMVGGKKTSDPKEAVRTMKPGAEVKSALDGEYFRYDAGNKSIVAATDDFSQSAHAFLTGSGSSVWLSATFNTTGSTSDMFGVTIESGGTARQLRFDDYGLSVMRDDTDKSGFAGKGIAADALSAPGGDKFPGQASIWGRRVHTQGGKTEYSTVYEMTHDETGSANKTEWAILNGILYYKVNGDVSGAVDLSLLDVSWKANGVWRIGFTAWDDYDYGDPLEISDISVKFGAEAEKVLVPNEQVKGAKQTVNMLWEPFTGSYLANSNKGAAYMVGEKGAQVGVRADLECMELERTASGVGVTVKRGDKSYEFVSEGRDMFHRYTNRAWLASENKDYDKKNFEGSELYKDDGSGVLSAYVKDGRLHIFYNHKQVYCIDMAALYPDYESDDSVEIGLFSWDGWNGLVHMRDIRFMNGEDEIDAQTEDILAHWGYFGIYPQGQIETANDCVRDYGGAAFAPVEDKRAVVPLYGSSDVWQIDGKAVRTSPDGGTTSFGLTVISNEDGKERRTNILICSYGFYFSATDSPLNGTAAFEHPNRNKTYKSFTWGKDNNAFDTAPYLFWQDVHSFAKKEGARTSEEFRFVICNDVLYVWLDSSDAPGDLQPAIRLPLTDANFGGHVSGADYGVQLVIDGTKDADVKTHMEMRNLDVRMGKAVLKQKDFIKVGGQDYSVTEFAKKLNANVSRWKETYRFMTVCGPFGEALCEFDLEGQKDTDKGYGNGCNYALFADAGTDLYIRGRWKRLTDADMANNGFGFIVMNEAGTQVRQVLFNTEGLQLMNTGWSSDGIAGLEKDFPDENPATNRIYKFQKAGSPKNHYVRTPAVGTGEIKKAVESRKNLDAVTELAVTGNTLYIRVNESVEVRLPMDYLCADWQPGTKYRIGFDNFELNQVKGFRIVDVETLSGDAAKGKLRSDDALDGIETSNMFFDAFSGEYAASQAAEAKDVICYALCGPSAGERAISVDVSLKAGSASGSLNGIAVSLGEKTAYLLFDKDGNVYTLSEDDAKNAGFVAADPIWSMEGMFESGKAGISAVLKGGSLYVSVNGAPGFKIALSRLLSDSSSGEARLGFAAYAPGKGLAGFGQVKIFDASGVPDIDIGAFEGISEAARSVGDPARGKSLIGRILGRIKKFAAAGR